MILTAAERVRRHQILLADAEFDVKINAEARAVFEAWLKHLRTTRLPNDFFLEPTSKDEASGIRYFNTYPGQAPQKKFKNVHLLMCGARYFSRLERLKNLTIIIAFHADVGEQNHGAYFGFDSNPDNKALVLYDLLQHAYDQPDEYFPEDEFYEDFFKPTKRLRELRSVFIHEYRHFDDDMRSSQNNNAPIASKAPKPGKDYSGYVNSTVEINARYAEWILSITNHLQSKKVKSVGIAETYPDFKSFWDLYWGKSGYIPSALKRYVTPENKKRLARRLYKFWDWAKTQKDLTDKKAAVFAKKQVQEDDEMVAPREF